MKTSGTTRRKTRRKAPHPAAVILQRVRKRTAEIAAAAGRGPLEIRRSDYEAAKRELTGESLPDRQLAILFPGGVS